MIAQEVVNQQPPARGHLSVVRRSLPPGLIRNDKIGHYQKDRRSKLLEVMDQAGAPFQRRALGWLRDNVHPEIPRAYYRATLGHDLHVSTFATLHVKHFHASEPDPFTGQLGWLENIGLVSQGKVTVAFRDFEVNQLVVDTTAYGDFKYHEVGLGVAAEANTDTALGTSTLIARVAGTQVVFAADQYRSVATVTADTAETWSEHGIFNALTGVSLMDRSLISPTVAVNIGDTVQFTYTLSKTAEA